jgi:predicted enzyme related to lactoylglutathione lyase
MGTRTGYAPGTFCWIDLSTSDPDAAKGFYAKLFGWDYDDREGAGGTYSMAMVGGEPVAAIVAQQPQEAGQGVPPHFNNYVSVEDADASLAKVKELGGTTLGDAFDVEGAGLIGVVIDPTGATLFLWQPKEHIGAGRVNEPGCLTWNELATTDADAAARFYAALFDWGLQTMEGPGSAYTIVKVGERSNGGIREQSSDERQAGIPPNWLPYIVVESADAATAKAGELGGGVLMGPVDMPNQMRIAALRDPQGAVFAIGEGPTDD